MDKLLKMKNDFCESVVNAPWILVGVMTFLVPHAIFVPTVINKSGSPSICSYLQLYTPHHALIVMISAPTLAFMLLKLTNAETEEIFKQIEKNGKGTSAEKRIGSSDMYRELVPGVDEMMTRDTVHPKSEHHRSNGKHALSLDNELVITVDELEQGDKMKSKSLSKKVSVGSALRIPWCHFGACRALMVNHLILVNKKLFFLNAIFIRGTGIVCALATFGLIMVPRVLFDGHQPMVHTAVFGYLILQIQMELFRRSNVVGYLLLAIYILCVAYLQHLDMCFCNMYYYTEMAAFLCVFLYCGMRLNRVVRFNLWEYIVFVVPTTYMIWFVQQSLVEEAIDGGFRFNPKGYSTPQPTLFGRYQRYYDQGIYFFLFRTPRTTL